MSRTHRTRKVQRIIYRGNIIDYEYWWEIPRNIGIDAKSTSIIKKKLKDKKPWYKPCRVFKQARRQQERAQATNAIRQDRDPPRIRRGDAWEWT